MKLALSNLAWNPADEDAAIALMKKYGFTGVEVALSKWPLLVRGFPTIAIQSLLYGRPDLQPFSTHRGETLRYLGLAAYVGDWLNAEVLVFGAPKNRQGNFGGAVDFFRDASDMGISLCVEPNPAQYGSTLITNTEEALELIKAVKRADFRLHLDSGIMTLNGETEIPSDIAHFHISQPYLAPVGPGTVDHVAMASALRAIDYKGWCSVEMLPCDNLEKSLEYVAGIYGD